MNPTKLILVNGFQQEKCTNSLTGEDFVETSSQKSIDANVDQIYKNVSKEQVVESSLGKIKVSRKGLPGKPSLFSTNSQMRLTFRRCVLESMGRESKGDE